MTYEYVKVSRGGHCTIVTINRPEASELEEVFDKFAADDEQWVAIIMGAGPKAFCAGHDLKQQAAGGG
ncbi:enoyl-CoA hydratase/carnithine racemase [Bradyrhizobium sp. USDA 10063]